MIKITSDLDEFWKREHCGQVTPHTLGLYKGNTIWYRYRSKPLSHILTILHEIGHLIVDKCFSEKYATLLLFSDFLDGVLDFINGVLRHQAWRIAIHECLESYIKDNFEDWIELGT